MANLTTEAIVIPARSFYSARQSSCGNTATASSGATKTKTASPTEKTVKNTRSHSTSPKSKSRSPKSNINRGVAHKIRRRSHRQDNAFSKPLRPLDINFILGNIKNEKLRDRIETKREQKQQIEKVHNILRTSENPIALARPLRGLNIGNDVNIKLSTNTAEEQEELSPLPFEDEAVEADFSDLDSLSDNDDDLTEKDFAALNPDKHKDDFSDNFEDDLNTDDEPFRSASELQESIETASVSSSRSATPNRKFFKSGRTASIPKEVRITENIRAMVCNGRMTLISEKKVRPKKCNSSAAELADAKAAVNNILKKFDDADETMSKTQALAIETKNQEVFFKETKNEGLNKENSMSDIELPEARDYSKFRKRIPYDTDDSVRIEEQHFLLDFLITHNICSEKNFLIFIADPESHRDEAASIVHQVLSTVGQNVDNCIEFETDSVPALSSSEDCCGSGCRENVHSALSETEKTSTSTAQDKLFPIFYNEKYKPLSKTPTQRRKQRSWNAGFGLNQMQIDAGQKEFGAKQCKQCGLVYTAHEAEEEKLHRDFHSSLHVLRFKGWIDEDRVADYQEWGRDGRIIRLTDSTHIKRRERLNEILKVVDKELGFSSYILPKVFVAFLAVRNCQIVGVCLVQPLTMANKYFCSDGVDCCTIEEFEAKCGISRIWVAPLNRRLHIGKKLVNAVCMNTIVGEEIPISKIAFSAPTEDGKRFAQNVTGNEHFLVYQ